MDIAKEISLMILTPRRPRHNSVALTGLGSADARLSEMILTLLFNLLILYRLELAANLSVVMPDSRTTAIVDWC
jgi:hypothetical protein